MNDNKMAASRLEADALFVRGDIAGALAIIEPLLTGPGSDASAGDYLYLARLHFAGLDFLRAASVLLEAAERWPQDDNMPINIAACYSKAGDLERSLEWLEVARQRTPQDVRVHELGARLNGYLGNRAIALEHGEMALTIKDAALAHKKGAVPLIPRELPPFNPNTPERNVIAFSLFGEQARYLTGAVENARLIPHIYPGWTGRFYVDTQTVPSRVVVQLQAAGADVILMPAQQELYEGLFWRFLEIGRAHV